jgi:hypothetical protein
VLSDATSRWSQRLVIATIKDSLLTPVLLATKEAEIRRIMVQNSS